MTLKINIIKDKTSKTQVEGFDFLNGFVVNQKLVAEVIKAEHANLRSGNAHTKNRAEVSGSGKKPWKQKGTGRARHGSKRSPIWVGGGVALGPRNTTNWSQKINKSARISALKSIVKDRLEAKSVFQFDNAFDFPKTKSAVDLMQSIFNDVNAKNLVIVYTISEKNKLNGFSNTDATLVNASNMKVFKIAKGSHLVLTPEAKILLETKLSK
jgi:large subunit ribosomal protein L4